MRQANPTVQHLAGRLLAHEAGGSGRDLGALAGAAERAGDRLRLHLSKIIGSAGFQALLARALALAKAEFSWLAPVQVEGDRPLTGLRVAAAEQDLVEATAGFAAVLGHLLGLLIVFIGEDLTGRLVRQVWPEADLVAPNPGLEDETKQR